MWRRPLVRVDVVRSWQYAREQFAALTAERDQLKRDLEWTRRDLAWAEQNVCELREAINELLAARRARQAAEDELVRLYRERDIERARKAERDPAAPLQ